MARTPVTTRRQQIEAEKARLEQEFAEKRARLATLAAQLDREEREAKRVIDDRRALIIGRALLPIIDGERLARSSLSHVKALFMRTLERTVKKAEDRELFGFAPLPITKPKAAEAPAAAAAKAARPPRPRAQSERPAA